MPKKKKVDREVERAISAVMSELGKRSAAKLTKAERKERAKKAISARWEKYRREKEKAKTPKGQR